MTADQSEGRRVRRAAPGRPRTPSPSLPAIVPAEGVSVERQVYGSLRLGMMRGAIQPGARLTIRTLSEELGVSPTPVREALKRLDADGALASHNKSAFIVYEPNRRQFEELFEIRLSLECQAIRRATEHVGPADIERLRRINQGYRTVVEADRRTVPDILAENFRFHFEIYKLSGSATLVSLIETLWLRIGPTLHRYTPADGNLSFHSQMIEALELKDPEMAVQALQNDLTAAFQAILPQLHNRAQSPQGRAPRAMCLS
jgi:GntR family colanic acid and biofilm gene transcriptional regulator